MYVINIRRHILGSNERRRSFVSNKIDAPASHLIELYAMRWRVETFFRGTKQDLGFVDCELRHAAGSSQHWHLLMLAYSLLKFYCTQRS
ncbi:transposase [Halorubrum coriense]